LTKAIKDVLQGISYLSSRNIPDTIDFISFDSRKIKQGSLFFAIKGENSDGHKYIPEAIKKGATAVVVEKYIQNLEVPQIKVNNTKLALSIAAANFYNNPSEKLKVTGITGTNGKTTVVHLLNAIFKNAGIHRGTIGTLGYTVEDEHYPTNLTTPDSITLQQILNKMVENSISHIAMEVSSHSLDLKRVEGIKFIGGVFTNLTQDHLDYHKTMDNYADAKSKLFEKVPQNGFLVCNIDDPYSYKFIQAAKAPISTISISNENAYFKWKKGGSLSPRIEGIVNSPIGDIEISCPLKGEYNLMNILSAIAVSVNLGIKPKTITKALQNVSFVPGRLQEISRPGFPQIFIDYAHTPDAIENVLKTLKDILPDGSRLIALFGCGGDRDRNKRPKMAKAVELFTDIAVLTSDNPRYEDPIKIIEETEKGFSNKMNYKKIPDRKEAILWALDNASPKDIVVLLGKGHEIYIEVEGIRYPFNEAEIIKDYLDGKAN
jgi:UDP-N-acetylmuramoyl-L-alanyl-D-glutamate--2,6-diaminopimelate ligase